MAWQSALQVLYWLQIFCRRELAYERAQRSSHALSSRGLAHTVAPCTGSHDRHLADCSLPLTMHEKDLFPLPGLPKASAYHP